MFDETVAQLRKDRQLRWPAPSDVRLFPIVLPSTHPHAAVFNAAQVPEVPGVANTPYFLADRLGTADDHTSATLLEKSESRPLIIFAPSGSGKTRALMQLLWSHHGTFLVAKLGMDFRNFGSNDMRTLVSTLLGRVTNFSPDHKRSYAEFGMRCILRMRLAVKEAWETSVGKPVTPAQWLLVQMHPKHFFGCDLFELVLLQVFALCRQDALVTRYERGYLTVVDEAQGLLSTLAGQIPSSKSVGDSSLPPTRSLLSPLITSVMQFSGNLIMAGTGLSMLQAMETAASGIATSSVFGIEGVFSELPFFTEANVRAFLTRLLQLPTGKGSLDAMCAWLCGRPRFTIRFAEDALIADRDVLPEALLFNFIDMMTTKKDDSKTIAGVLTKMRHDARLANADLEMPDLSQRRKLPESALPGGPVSSDEDEIEEGGIVTGVFESFKMAAWDEVNGVRGRVPRLDSLALVEAGLARMPSKADQQQSYSDQVIHLEPLVRETARLMLFRDTKYLKKDMLRTSSNAASLGFVFERSIPLLVIPSIFKSPPERFESNPIVAGAKLPKEFHGCWQPYLSHYGRIAEPGCNLLDWLKGACAIDGDDMRGLPAGLYPEKEAGPDFVCLVEHVTAEAASRTGWVASTPRKLALVLVQAKLAKSVQASTAALTVNPKLLYHKKRRTAQARLNGVSAAEFGEFLENLRTMLVVRVVVSAAEDVANPQTPLAEIVKHGRTRSAYEEDLLIMVRGEARVRTLFGAKFARFLKDLKVDEVDENEV